MLHFVLAALAASSAFAVSPMVVEVITKQGTVEGSVEGTGERGRQIFVFRGIPYAAPPIGELRFKDPAPPAPWTNFRAVTTPPPCPQPKVVWSFDHRPEIIGNEDCLYLNVFTPKPFEEAELPVMVFIHGGGFLYGDPAVFGGRPNLLLQKDVVLVTMQYRLGTLGFMSTGDSVLPGNLGLKDQSFALKWVQENILQFGGNPKSVTLFGHSAGGASTHFHMLSPYSRGLFQQAILQAGSALSPWAVRDDHQKIMLQGAKSLGCPGTDQSPPNSAQILQCLKGKSVEDLVRMAMPGNTVTFLTFYMAPRVDGDFLPAHPAQLLGEGRYQKVNVIAGVCQNEGASYVTAMLNAMPAVEKLFKDMDIVNLARLAKIFMGMDDEDNFEYLMKRAFYQYLGKIDISEDKAEELEKFLADYTMTIPVDLTVLIHASDILFGKSVYRYELQHRGLSSFVNLTGYTSKVTDKWIAHGDLNQYIFNGVEGFRELTRPDDIFLSDIIVTLWTNFARTGNPTPDQELGFKWEPASNEMNMKLLSLTPAPEMKDDNRLKSREFWFSMPTKNIRLLRSDFLRKKDNCLN